MSFCLICLLTWRKTNLLVEYISQTTIFRKFTEATFRRLFDMFMSNSHIYAHLQTLNQLSSATGDVFYPSTDSTDHHAPPSSRRHQRHSNRSLLFLYVHSIHPRSTSIKHQSPADAIVRNSLPPSGSNIRTSEPIHSHIYTRILAAACTAAAVTQWQTVYALLYQQQQQQQDQCHQSPTTVRQHSVSEYAGKNVLLRERWSRITNFHNIFIDCVLAVKKSLMVELLAVAAQTYVHGSVSDHDKSA